MIYHGQYIAPQCVKTQLREGTLLALAPQMSRRLLNYPDGSQVLHRIANTRQKLRLKLGGIAAAPLQGQFTHRPPPRARPNPACDCSVGALSAPPQHQVHTSYEILFFFYNGLQRRPKSGERPIFSTGVGTAGFTSEKPASSIAAVNDGRLQVL